MKRTQKQILIATIGLPASGKDFWCKQRMEEESPGVYKRINKDDIRTLLDLGKWSRTNEEFVVKARDNLIELALQDGWSVICTDTNLAEKHQIRLKEIAKKYEAEFIIQDFRGVSLDECIKRDQKRPNYVGEKVIRQMYNQYLTSEAIPAKPIKIDPQLSTAVIFDIDGTLALFGNANPYERDFLEDKINIPIRNILNAYKLFVKIILVSGRMDKFRDQTEKWLSFNEIEYVDLFMRKTDDRRQDTVVKREIYDNEIKGKYNIEFIVDDRPQVIRMWRKLGLFVLDCGTGIDF